MGTLQQLPNSRLIVEEDTPHATEGASTQTPIRSEAQAEWDAVTRALRLISQRVLAAVGHGISFVAIAIAAMLWCRVMDNPTAYQLTGLGLYGVFALAMIWLKGR